MTLGFAVISKKGTILNDDRPTHDTERSFAQTKKKPPTEIWALLSSPKLNRIPRFTAEHQRGYLQILFK